MAYNPDRLSRGHRPGPGPGPGQGSDSAPAMESSPLSQSLAPHQLPGRFNEDFDASQRGSSILLDGDGIHRSASRASQRSSGAPGGVSRSGTLKKKNSVTRRTSIKRSGSRRSMHAGSIKGIAIQDDSKSPDSFNNVFHTPVPTSGTPTDILANRFQGTPQGAKNLIDRRIRLTQAVAWRKLLKDLITYFREVQSSYETRAKALMKVSNVINNTNTPSVFLTDGGINEANRILRDYHKQSVVEANKARDIETDVISQLSGLRSDLGNKIKEIKSLSGDFKNSVEKEKDGTRKAVAHLEDALAAVEIDPSSVAGKGDPFVVRLSVERQIEKQIEEENYLHRAYLNLEGSGRELESIVVGEIQKAYNALAGILKREADEAYDTVERLRAGPVSIPKDLEWTEFVEHDPHFVNPRTPLRNIDEIEYPGKHHPAAAEIRAGMLERKSKYLKSYTPGWYVLSPTHLHEFKSADRIYTQPPVMSLYLPDQKLGTHSQPGSSSHKFILKGRQAGSMHRGHTWVFRAESYDTMLAWYEDIRSLTETSGLERETFIRKHTRSVSQGSARSVSSDGLDDNEADEVPYSAQNSDVGIKQPQATRPAPGGRFPSDLAVNHHLQAPLSPSSGSSDADHDLTTAAGGLQHHQPETSAHYAAEPPRQYYQPDTNQYEAFAPGQADGSHDAQYAYRPQVQQVSPAHSSSPNAPDFQRHNSTTTYQDWLAPTAGAAAGAAGAEAFHRQHEGRGEGKKKAAEVASRTPLERQNSSFAPTVDSEGAFVAAANVESNGTADSRQDTVTTTDASQKAGNSFPPMDRRDTEVSVSNLHIPGEYPRQGSMAT
ncbi:hypothetical protein IWX50DRAFT_706101 [Phyllosticta citricarpa]|uniref:PH domain-containing protein n=1 Tax=Phyllosticta citricarpa TaxID=55181 RepID=A0ABR1M788_9PEZI